MRRSQSSDAASYRNGLEDRGDARDKTTMWRLGTSGRRQTNGDMAPCRPSLAYAPLTTQCVRGFCEEWPELIERNPTKRLLI